MPRSAVIQQTKLAAELCRWEKVLENTHAFQHKKRHAYQYTPTTCRRPRPIKSSRPGHVINAATVTNVAGTACHLSLPQGRGGKGS